MLAQSVAIAVVTFVASVIGTMSGFGTSTILVSTLPLFLVFPLPQTLLFVGIIHIFADLWKMLLFRRGFDWKLIAGFGVPAVAASVLGAWLTLGIEESALIRAMGACLAAYGAFIIARPAFKVPRRNRTAFVGGAASGLVAGLLGVGGPIRGAFLAAYDLPKAAYISTAGAIALVTDLARVTTYVAGGARMPELYAAGLPAFVVVSLAGAMAAQRIVNSVSQKSFRRIIAAFLVAVGMKFLFLP